MAARSGLALHALGNKKVSRKARSRPSSRKPRNAEQDFTLNLSRKPAAASDANSREGRGVREFGELAQLTQTP